MQNRERLRSKMTIVESTVQQGRLVIVIMCQCIHLVRISFVSKLIKCTHQSALAGEELTEFGVQAAERVKFAKKNVKNYYLRSNVF